MPPKKKGGKSKDDPAKFVDKENLKRAETEIVSLQKLLELRSFDALESRRNERLCRERTEAIAIALEQQREDTLDITSDMMRQYKAMQEQMMRKIGGLEGEKRELQRQLDDKDGEIARLQAEKEQQRRIADSEISDLKKKTEEMQQEFAELLRSTLDRMHQRLEQAHDAQLFQ